MADYLLEASSPSGQWQAALATYEMAKLDLTPDFGSDAVTDFYVDAQFHALDALMTTPAPDMSAFTRKLEIFIAEECGHFFSKFLEPMHASLLADARRLGGAL